jgi:hypothetical protein
MPSQSGADRGYGRSIARARRIRGSAYARRFVACSSVARLLRRAGHSWVIGAVGGLITASAGLAGGVAAAGGPCLADQGGEDGFGGCSGLRQTAAKPGVSR